MSVIGELKSSLFKIKVAGITLGMASNLRSLGRADKGFLGQLKMERRPDKNSLTGKFIQEQALLGAVQPHFATRRQGRRQAISQTTRHAERGFAAKIFEPLSFTNSGS